MGGEGCNEVLASEVGGEGREPGEAVGGIEWEDDALVAVEGVVEELPEVVGSVDGCEGGWGEEEEAERGVGRRGGRGCRKSDGENGLLLDEEALSGVEGEGCGAAPEGDAEGVQDALGVVVEQLDGGGQKVLFWSDFDGELHDWGGGAEGLGAAVVVEAERPVEEFRGEVGCSGVGDGDAEERRVVIDNALVRKEQRKCDGVVGGSDGEGVEPEGSGGLGGEVDGEAGGGGVRGHGEVEAEARPCGGVGWELEASGGSGEG